MRIFVASCLPIVCLALTACGGGSASRSGEQWDVLEEVLAALGDLDADRLSACFDTSDATGASAVARLRRGVAIMVKGRALEARVRERFGEACARDTVGTVPAERSLRHYRDGLMRGQMSVGTDDAQLIVRKGAPPLRFVKRTGRWFVLAPTLFGDDKNGEQQTDMLLQAAEGHIDRAAQIAEQAADEAEFRAQLDALGREVKGQAGPLFRNLSPLLWSRGH